MRRTPTRFVALTAVVTLGLAGAAAAATPKAGNWGSEGSDPPSISFKVAGDKIKDLTYSSPTCVMTLNGKIKVKDSGKFRFDGNIAEPTGEEHPATIAGKFTSKKKGTVDVEVEDTFCGDKSELDIKYQG
jgi:hypothetical protein